jgi:hypothetical protein
MKIETKSKLPQKGVSMKAVLVATDTDRRGVFFGYVPDDLDLQAAIKEGCITLVNYRNCIYWSRSVGGVFGLAQTGPDANCRIGERVEQPGLFNGVTYIGLASPEAIAAWEAAPCVQ